MLTHVEISIPRDTLSGAFETDLDRLFVDVFGWPGTTRRFFHPVDKTDRAERIYRLSSGQSLVLAEADVALQPGTDDHLGVHVDLDEFDRLVTGCVALAAADPRVELKYVTDGAALTTPAGGQTLRTFFVRFLLPVWIQVENRG